jgi:hypothetical protein
MVLHTDTTENAYAIYVMMVFYVAERAGLDPQAVLAYRTPRKYWKKNQPRAALQGARAMAIYLCVTLFNVPKWSLAKAIEVPRSTIQSLIHRISDLRDVDQSIESWIAKIETALTSRRFHV